MNYPGPLGYNENGLPVFTPADSNVRPHIKLNQDNNLYKSQNFYMIDSTYRIASNPNSMRD